MFSLRRRPILTWPRLTKAILQNHRSIYSKPAKEKIGPGQSFIALFVFAATLLTPAGWIMHHIPEYRRRSPQQP
ncbi:hypothetical protein PBY51_010637 [Eleginops maclovinus]|uniref:Uncharacterized protein n=1 Tax=Eleginops maclovinus TaxID=56733 RepID=A0AAN7X931_ELEMC|nr:hypothetical protein PBY51_010637 [Eleginops maclovinus]